MPLKYELKTAILSSNNEVGFDSDSITLIVGPNNSGKSCFLREISKIIEQGINTTASIRKVIKNITFNIEGDRSNFENFLHTHTKQYNKPTGQKFLRALNVDVLEETAFNRWENSINGLHESASLFCIHADTINRLTIANPPQSINRLSDTPQHPIHALYEDEEIEIKLSKHFQRAFGQDLILNRGAGSILPLHIGQRPSIETGEDRVSKSYLEKLEKLPLINEQGDGIKSFTGCLLTSLVMTRFITLLDEPEAFLHPPQARLLGTILASEHNNNQLIIATHSGDLLRGILDTNSAKLNVLRITRKENENYAVKLNPEDLKLFWSDPILRFSNILDGLFHEAIIICEADTDCRFYSAVMSSIFDKKEGDEKRKPDFFFTSSGGVGRIKTITKALHKIKLPTRVIVDFDILFNLEQTKELYESLGGNWEGVKQYYDIIKNSIDEQAALLSTPQVCEGIKQVLENIDQSIQLSERSKSEIQSFLKPSASLKRAKKEGMAIFSDSSKIAFNSLIKEFKNVGLWIVPYGELESFDKTTKGHGVAWVAKALEKDIVSSPEFQLARDFITELVQFAEVHTS